MHNCGCRRFAALLIKKYSLQGREFVGNGLDRFVIDAATAMINKIRIKYNIQQFEPEQASLFPTTSLRVFFNS